MQQQDSFNKQLSLSNNNNNYNDFHKKEDNIQQKTKSLNYKKISTIIQKLIKNLGINYIAYLSWLIAVILWQTGFLYYNQNHINPFQSTLSRGIGLLIFNAILCKINNKQFISVYSLKYLNIRSIIIVLYGYIFTQAMFYLPLTIVQTVFFSGSLFIFIQDYFLNKITVNKKQLIGVFIATMGSLLTINSPIMQAFFTTGKYQEYQTKFQNYKTQSVYLKLIAGVILVLSAFAWAYAQILAKRIQKSTHYQSNFHLAVTFVFIFGVLYVFKPLTQLSSQKKYQNCSQKQFNNIITLTTSLSIFLKSLFFSGLVLALSQALMIISLQLTKNTGTVTIVGSTTLIYSYLLSMIRYDQKLNYFCLIGAFLIVFGVYQIVKKKQQ